MRNKNNKTMIYLKKCNKENEQIYYRRKYKKLKTKN